jgi:hypothetical protein
MSWGPGAARIMKRLRKVAATMLVAVMLVVFENGRTSAQEAPPDLRMLMNLDLFEPRHNDAQGAPASASAGDGSMLDQIRTLDAMGYLGNHDDAGADDLPTPRAASVPPGAEDIAPSKAPPQMPSSHPSIDVEGPQE